MSPVERIAQLLETHVGFKRSRILQVARALSEGGVIASGGPGRAPEYSRDDVVAILVGVATGAKIERVAETTRAALATTPGGADVGASPLSIPRTLRSSWPSSRACRFLVTASQA